MNPKIRLQLSVMMFLQFFIWGGWYVTGPNYLGTIGFTAKDFGWMYSVGPIAGMISPFFVGMVADRFFAAQRVLGVMHLVGAGMMFLATLQMRAEAPNPNLINVLFFGHMLAYFPTLALTNSLAMRNMSDPEKEFPGIRVLGTIGWIIAGLMLSWLGWGTRINMFYLMIWAAVLLGAFSFFLPHTPPTATGKVSAREVLGLDALVLLKNRSYLVFLISSMLICIPLAFYYQIASRVVEMMQFQDVPGFSEAAKAVGLGDAIGLVMSFGQMSEIVFMLVMPFFFRRLGVKWMLAVGMLAWVLRYVLFAIGAPEEVRWMVLMGILLHGICYDFFFVTGQIYTDQAAPRAIRSQAQGMLVLFTLGLGMFIGAQIAGRVEAQHTTEESKAFAQQVIQKRQEIQNLESRIGSASGPEATVLTEQLGGLERERADLRRKELQAIEWKPLWGKPAIFAGIVMLLFLVFFRNPPRREDSTLQPAPAPEPGPAPVIEPRPSH
jgi:nucleoside transporter